MWKSGRFTGPVSGPRPIHHGHGISREGRRQDHLYKREAALGQGNDSSQGQATKATGITKFLELVFISNHSHFFTLSGPITSRKGHWLHEEGNEFPLTMLRGGPAGMKGSGRLWTPEDGHPAGPCSVGLVCGVDCWHRLAPCTCSGAEASSAECSRTGPC